MKDIFRATRQKSRDQIVSCSLVSALKLVLAIYVLQFKLIILNRLLGRYLPVYPLSLGLRLRVFYENDLGQINAMTGDYVFLLKRLRLDIVLTNETYITSYHNFTQSHPAFVLRFLLARHQTLHQTIHLSLQLYLLV